jgi:hypothetical protein
MSRFVRVSAMALAIAVAGGVLSGCASKSVQASQPSTSPSASIDAGLLNPTLAQWIRYSGVLQHLRDSNSTLLTMQTTATTKITDSKSLAAYVTEMKASGTAAVLIGQSLENLVAPDSGMTQATQALGSSLKTLGQKARALDAVKIATAGKGGAAVLKAVVVQMTDAVAKTKAVATYAAAHSKDPVKL